VQGLFAVSCAKKQLNRSRCRLGRGLGWVQGSMLDRGAHQRHLANTVERYAAMMRPFAKLFCPLVDVTANVLVLV